MELDELKNNWKLMESGISDNIDTDNQFVPANKLGNKSKAIRRFCIGAASTALCMVFLATSHLWAPVKLSAVWLTGFCVLLLFGTVSELHVLRAIKRVDLCASSHVEIFDTVLRIKRFYRMTELYGCIAVCAMLFWLTFLPPVQGTFRAPLLWIATPVGMLAEFLWYRRNIKEINKLSDENDNNE